MNEIKCVINSPISEVTSKEGNMIVLPGSKGELGVLYNHMPMIVELRDGKIRIYNNAQIEQEIDIQGGIAYIKKDIIEVFCT